MSALSDLFTDIATEIRGKTGETGTMKPAEFPDKIAGIETGGEVTPDYVGFATFMNGDVELYKMPFIKGYDCPNPLTEGLIETPTKESTVSTDYTYSGWDNNLTDLTEDVVVKAVFSESVRYYTVTFYDDDGTTVLQTLSVAYGSTPNLENPEKQGYSFSNWNPDLTTVTGDTSYQAVWLSTKSFNESSWSEIQTAVNNQVVGEQWALGATKDITLTWEDGTTTEIEVEIARYNLESYFNKTTLFLLSKTLMPDIIKKASKNNGYYGYTDCTNATKCDTMYEYLNTTIKNALPEDMRNVVDLIRIPETAEMGFLNSTTYEDNVYSYRFDCFTEDASSRIKTTPDGSVYGWWADGKASSASDPVRNSRIITKTGSVDWAEAYSSAYGVLPVFEIKPKT